MIVDEYEIIERLHHGGAYDGNTTYAIKLIVDGREYISTEDYTLKEAVKVRDEMRKRDGY